MAAPALLLATLMNARAAETWNGQSFYFGDLHAHTGVSYDAGSSDMGNCDGECGALDAVFDIARDNGLDFLALTEHIPQAKEDEYLGLVARMLEVHEPGVFVTIPAGEYDVKVEGESIGHKNIFMFGSNEDLATLDYGDLKAGLTFDACEDVWEFPATIESEYGPTLFFAHHPTASSPADTDYSCHSDLYEPVIEIYSQHGNGLEFPSAYDGSKFEVATGATHTALGAFGYQIGFVGGTDSHDTKPGATCDLDPIRPAMPVGGGLTVAVMDEGTLFDRDTLYTTISSRQTYVTTGPLVPATFQAEVGDQTVRMGAAVFAETGQTLRLTVQVMPDYASHVTGVTLVDAMARTSFQAEGDGTWQLTMTASLTTPSWMYAEIEIDGASYYTALESPCSDGGDDDREYLWMSPLFVTVLQSPLDDAQESLDVEVQPDRVVEQTASTHTTLGEQIMNGQAQGTRSMRMACSSTKNAPAGILLVIGMMAALLRRRS